MSESMRLAKELMDIRTLALGHATSPQLGNSSLDGGRISFRDGDGKTIGTIDVSNDGGFEIIHLDGPKPPKPSAPTVTADAGIFRVEWDGSFVNTGDEGVLATSDLDRVEIHASMDENFVPDRVLSFGGAFSSLEGGSFALGPLAESGTYYFRLVARSRSKQFSEPSDRAEQELAIAGIDLAVTDAWLTGESARMTADGKNTIWRGPDEPVENPDKPHKDGDIWFEMVDGKSIPNIWDDALGEWVGNDDFRQSEIEKVQDELREDLDAVITDGSGTKNFYRGTMPADAESSEGDLWFDSSDKNIPYIYEDGEWVTVQSSFDTPGAGESLSSLAGGGSLEKVVTSDAEFAKDESRTGRWTYGGTTSAGDMTFAIPAVGGVDPSTFNMTFDGTEATKAGLGLVADTTLYINSPGGTPTVQGIFLVAGGALPEPTAVAYSLPVEAGSGGRADATHHVDGVSGTSEVVLSRYLAAGLADQVAFGIRVTLPYAPGAWVEMGTLSVTQAVTSNGITSEAVTTEKIAAGAITAESGIIGSINAGTITVGEMNGAHIESQTIYSDKLLIGGDRNLIPNGELDKGSAVNWPSTGTYREVYGPPGNDDTPNVAFPAGVGYTYDFSDMGTFPVEAGDTLVFECWIKSSTDGASVYFTLQDQTGPSTSTSGRILNWTSVEGDAAGSQGPMTHFQPGASWSKVVSKVKVPAGVTSVVLQCAYFNHSGGSVTDAAWYMAGMKLYKQVGATLIEDGSIITSKIAAGAITADSGIIGSIDANTITVGKIMGNQLDADAINGKTITGAKIRTASSGSRVEVTQNGLKQYNSLGATIVDMTAGSFALEGGSITGSTIRTAASGSRVEIDSDGLRQYDSSGEVTTSLVEGALVMDGGYMLASGFGAGTGWISRRPDGRPVQVSISSGTSIDSYGTIETWDENENLMFEVNPVANRMAIAAPTTIEGDLRVTEGGITVEDSSTSPSAVDMHISRDEYGLPAIMATSDNWAGNAVIAYETGLNKGLIITSPPRSSSNDVYSIAQINDDTAYFGVGGTDAGSDSPYIAAYSNDNLVLNGRRVQSDSIYNTTGVTSASVYINQSTGSLGRNTSSRRYKQDIRPAEALDSLLEIETHRWKDRNAVAQHEESQAYLDEVGEGPLPRGLSECPSPPGFEYGAIAEEVDDLGLEDLVIYDQYGRPDSLHYEKFGIALIPIMRELRDRIEDLEAQLPA